MRIRERACLLGLASLLGCSHSFAPGGVGASIAVVLDGTRVAVVNPDGGSISFLEPQTLSVLATVPVGDQPRALLPLSSGELWVTTYRGGELVVVDPVARRVTQRQPLCAGPLGLAAAADESFVVVACEYQGSVLRIDPHSLAVTTLATGLRRPRAVAVIGSEIFAAEFTGGAVVQLGAQGSVTRTALKPQAAPYRPALTEMAVSQAAALLPAFDGLHVAHMLVNNGGHLAGEQEADDYGSVVDGNPKINPAVTSFSYRSESPGAALAPGATPVLYAQFAHGARVFSGPVALAALPPRYLLVAHVSTRNVAVLDTLAQTPETRAVASYVVGAGPLGVAVDAARQVAYVDNALEQSVSRIDLRRFLGGDLPAYPAELTRTRPAPAAISPAALAGRRLFYDAANVHVTPAGVLACSTCHPDGGEDGLVWFISTSRIPLKRRRTPGLANTDRASLLHWDGAFKSMSSLVQGTITDLMAGDGLLVDFDSINAYVRELVTAPRLPVADEAARSRGQRLFESPALGCATCHPSPTFSDQQLHAPLTPMSLTADDRIDSAKTADLRGVFLRAPYFHDGRSPTLLDLLTRVDARSHGAINTLSETDRADVVAYLESL